MRDPDLAVPVALDAATRRVVWPYEGRPGVRYRCPGDCGVDIVFRRSSMREDNEIRRAHFAHVADDAGCGESARHRGAKHAAARALDAWRLGEGRPPTVLFTCEKCASVRELDLEGLSPTVDATTEHRLPSGRIVDVWCGFAVEIFASHAVDDEKAAELSSAGIRWVEVDADSVLASPVVPRWRSPLRRLRPTQCLVCSRDEVARARMELAEALRDKQAAIVWAAKARDEAAAAAEKERAATEGLADERRVALDQAVMALAEARASRDRQEALELQSARARPLGPPEPAPGTAAHDLFRRRALAGLRAGYGDSHSEQERRLISAPDQDVMDVINMESRAG